MKGLIIRGVGGFYYVKTANGLYQAKGRGIFKKQGITLAVGDNVDIEVLPDGDAVINSIDERQNHFIRPPIANIDAFVVVVAASKPKPNFALIDKFLIMAEMHSMEAIICINKCDLVTEEELKDIKNIYGSIYKIVETSGASGEGISELLNLIKNKKVAFAGPSGVGKSTITNLVIPEANMETGEVSRKTSRGKHTTRHVEIFEAKFGGMVFDTPGFTSFDILEATEDDLQDYYPEFHQFKGECRFDNCRHIKEPDCRIRDAVSDNLISPIRYNSYIKNMEEIRNKRKY